MNKKLFLIFLLIFCNNYCKTYSNAFYKLSLNDNWAEFPKDSVAELINKEPWLSKTLTYRRYDYLYLQHKYDNSFFHRYFLIQINKNGKITKDEFLQFGEKYYSYDSQTNYLWKTGDSTIDVLIPTEFGSINIFCFSERSNYYKVQKDFEPVINSISIPSDYKYSNNKLELLKVLPEIVKYGTLTFVMIFLVISIRNDKYKPLLHLDVIKSVLGKNEIKQILILLSIWFAVTILISGVPLINIRIIYFPYVVIYFFAFMIVTGLLILSYGNKDPEFYGIKEMRISIIPGLIVSALVFYLLVEAIKLFILPVIASYITPDHITKSIPDLASFPNSLYTLFLAPVSEEFFFRGFLQSRLANILSGKNGIHFFGKFISLPVLLTALLFGLSHILLIFFIGKHLSAFLIFFILNEFIFASLAGIMLGYFREKTGSLIPGIILHMLFNLPAVISLPGI